MSARNYGDSLAGKSWDAVRAVRRQVIGNTGELLDASVVPEEFHDLLPFASLLSSGEEPLSEDFWSALDSDARNVFVSRLDRARAARVQEWARRRARSAPARALRFGEPTIEPRARRESQRLRGLHGPRDRRVASRAASISARTSMVADNGRPAWPYQ